MSSDSRPHASAPSVDSWVGTPEQIRWLTGIAKTILALNGLDAIFTLVWVHAGLAHEANFLLRDLVIDHPILFVLVKLVLVSAGSYLLWRYRRRPSAVIGLFLAFLTYYFILIYHLQYSSLLARHWLAG